MAKKIVRGITNVKTINNQDYDTNNVNDLLSDGQYSYIHRKKGKSEEYHNLTDNIKTISSDNTDLLTVTNNNKTTNTATLSPKHDPQKEQVLESERATITIKHGTNATTEKTKVDTNPQKVLEHSNLLTDYGISKTTAGNTTKLGLEYTRLGTKHDGEPAFDLNNLRNGRVQTDNYVNSPVDGNWYLVSSYNDFDYTFQEAIDLTNHKNTTYRRVKYDGDWEPWREQASDKSIIDSLLTQKQNTLVSNTSIGVGGDNTLRQLFYYSKTYSQDGGALKTHVKSLAKNTSITDQKDEYNFLIRLYQGARQLTFELEETDRYFFSFILGSSNTANISGCIFTLSGSTLTVSTANNTDKDYIVSYSELFA